MNKIVQILFFSLCINTTYAQIKTPAASPAASVSQAIGLGMATIEYSRPSLKGRKMIGADLVPYGKVWRTGANKIPNLILTQEMNIEGKTVAAGTYGLATIPGENEWTIIITKNAGQWGVYDYKEAEDFMRFKVKADNTKSTEEHFTMGFNDFTSTSTHLFIAWENTMVKFVISQNPEKQIMAEIKEKTGIAEVNKDTYYGAAEYYLENGKDLKQAFEWANKAVEKERAYWNLSLRAKIAQKLGKCDVAKADAKEGVELAKKDNDASYVTSFNKILDTCK